MFPSITVQASSPNLDPYFALKGTEVALQLRDRTDWTVSGTVTDIDSAGIIMADSRYDWTEIIRIDMI